MSHITPLAKELEITMLSQVTEKKCFSQTSLTTIPKLSRNSRFSITFFTAPKSVL